MIKYDNNGEIIACLLDETGVISKERIKQENYKQYKKDFDEVVELLSLNKLYHSMCSELLNYEITDDLEFKTIVIDKYDTPTIVKNSPVISFEDNEILTMDKQAYEYFYELCINLLIKVKRSWDKLNEVERFIIKCLEFDTPPDTDENISYKLKYDSKKYYQFKESAFIKLGIQLKVGETRKSKFFLFPEEVENGDNVYLDFE